jgi:hypothetical protein
MRLVTELEHHLALADAVPPTPSGPRALDLTNN